MTRFLFRHVSLVCLFACLVISTPSRPQSNESIRDRYTKREVLIPMRDGVKLFTSVYIPKDASRPYPILLERTPYSVAPYGPDKFPSALGPNPQFDKEGFIFAYQDVRGRLMSEGVYEDMRPMRDTYRGPQDTDESTDTYDTVDWLIKNIPNNNGNVGMWGISYPGFYAAAGLIRSHPALKAVSPQAPIADWFIGDDDHHNGALFLMDCFSFQPFFGPARPKPTTQWPPSLNYGTNDGYKFYMDLGPLRNANTRYFHGKIKYWNDVIAHGTYDSFWQAHNLLPHLKDIHCAVLIVGGWFDAEDLYGPLKIFQMMERTQPGIENHLVMGPWNHGGWAGGDGSKLGDIPFGSKTAAEFRNEVELPFFNYYLKGVGALDVPRARVFQTGSNRWLSLPAWPPKDLKPADLYLQNGSSLSFTRPATTGVDEYVSDPAKPVAYTAHNTINRGIRYMIEDQRFVAKRSDVLSYRSQPLTQDMSLAGPITAKLFVSTTGTDADFIVKVIDEYPDHMQSGEESGLGGYQMLVRAEVMRGKFRNSYSRPEPFVPGKVTAVNFELRDVCHTFRTGHRIMVQIQSSWFPLVDRNPQTFSDIYSAPEAAFHKATIRIYHSRAFPSHITVGMMDNR